MLDNPIVVVALVGIIGTLAAPILAARSANFARKDQKLKVRHDYFLAYMNILAQKLGEYEVWLSKYPHLEGALPTSEPATEHARIIGEAIAVCLAVGDASKKGDMPYPGDIPDIDYHSSKNIYEMHRLTYIADKRLTRNLVLGTEGPNEKKEVEMWGRYDDRNRHALNHAIKRLAQLIADTL